MNQLLRIYCLSLDSLLTMLCFRFRSLGFGLDASSFLKYPNASKNILGLGPWFVCLISYLKIDISNGNSESVGLNKTDCAVSRQQNVRGRDESSPAKRFFAGPHHQANLIGVSVGSGDETSDDSIVISAGWPSTASANVCCLFQSLNQKHSNSRQVCLILRKPLKVFLYGLLGLCVCL